MSWILTHTGKCFDLLHPKAELVSTVDIAHALSQMPRFNGHGYWHYSVAQHSVLVAGIVPEQDRLPALLHDATEAYIADLTRPFKQLLMEVARQHTEAWLDICVDAGMPRDVAGIKAALIQILPDSQGQGLSILLDTYRQIEQRIWFAICERFDIEPDLPSSVKEADMVALATERRELMPDHPSKWECLAGYQALPCSIPRMTPPEARQAFHDQLLELLGTSHRRRAFA
ncbi:hypothetical protein [Pseudomonas indica]|uniref:Phosphohydrolase n=1 Tax=Pseudomonas indica TaxID=137658 RepID=A0A1G8V1H9_9PSED|nr:hypothetical protein [Pseudomonas indica]SDJ59956.1 hypothetical protein SAMN05216186_10268 [Pseudomonas indica]